MNFKIVVVGGLSLFGAGCTGEASLSRLASAPMGLGMAAEAGRSEALIAPSARSSRVMAAMALESATGRKPDPARLAD